MTIILELELLAIVAWWAVETAAQVEGKRRGYARVH